MEGRTGNSYEAFESLIKSFEVGGTKSEQNSVVLQPVRREYPGKRRTSARSDPRSEAPPLVPLVEEGDQLQEAIRGNTEVQFVVRGKWKHSNITKSNHMNGPDFDSLETASVTSCSSAYSSKSESTPPCGSVTELSDLGSCDTYQEYDIQSSQRKNSLQYRPQNLLIEVHDESSERISNIVKANTQAWNNVIGHWKFDRVSPLTSPSKTFQVTNEIRLPTPLHTPQGSMDSCESKCSVNEDESWIPPVRQYKLGKFIHRRSLSTSSLASAFQSTSSPEVNDLRSFSGIDLSSDGGIRVNFEIPGNSRNDIKEAEGAVDQLATDEVITEQQATTIDKEAMEEGKCDELKEDDSVKGRVMDKPNVCKRSSAVKDTTPVQQTPHSQNTSKNTVTRKVSERIKLFGMISHEHSSHGKPPSVKLNITQVKSSKWLEAYNKSKALKTVQEAQSEGTAEQFESEDATNVDSIVKRRAQLFGGTKKTLHRSQSLHF